MCIYLTLPKNNLIHSLEGPFLKLQGCWYSQMLVIQTPLTRHQSQNTNPVAVTSLQMLDFQGVILHLLWKTDYFSKSNWFHNKYKG